MSGVIEECGVNILSYERALELTPPEFAIGYDWFQDHEGQYIASLPHRSPTLVLPSEIKLSADRGIHSPNYGNLASRGANKEKYVLSIHSTYKSTSNSTGYDDKEIIYRDDGTWVFDYCAHKPTPGSRLTERGNEYLLNNLRDGVPVAVLVQQRDRSYLNLGLAYVERYDPITDIFTLHGPVSSEAINSEFVSIISFDELTSEEREVFKAADRGDQRKRVKAERIVREKQAEFRRGLLEAYDGSCAITSIDIPEVLQAAHIDPYRGKYSQVVSNGILLRSDLHLLYDSHLLTILPESNLIQISNRLDKTIYSQYDGERIYIPGNPQLRPNDKLLDLHRQQFEINERRSA